MTFTVSDGTLNASELTNITVNEVYEAPVANLDSGTVDQGDAVTINLTGNDTDADGTVNVDSIAIVAGPSNGVVDVHVDGTGTVTYTPNADFNGTDSFTYTVNDDGGDTSNQAIVSITINPIADPPSDSPKSLLRDALAQLILLKEESKGNESKRIEMAVKEIGKALDDKLWVDEFRLDSKHGDKAFRRIQKALKELTHLVEGMGKDKNASPEPQLALDELVLAGRTLVTTLLDDVAAVDPKQDKADKELAKAEKELAKGDAERSKDKALQHYGKAWEHVDKAAK